MNATLLSLVSLLAVCLLIANILTTRHLWLDPRRTRSDKIAETGLVWIVPVFGPLVALAISLDGPSAVRAADPLPTAAAAAGAQSTFLL